MTTTLPKLKLPLAPFNDHKNCSGHANYMLDTDYVKKEDRDVFDKVLGYYQKTRIA